MILFAEDYYNLELDGHRSYVVEFSKKFNSQRKPNYQIKKTLKLRKGDKPYIMQNIKVKAIGVAFRLVELLGLKPDRGYVSRPLPWMDPGVHILISDDIIEDDIIQELLRPETAI